MVAISRRHGTGLSRLYRLNMFITLCYVFLTYTIRQRKNNHREAVATMMRTQISTGSLVFQRILSQSFQQKQRILKPAAKSISSLCEDGDKPLAADVLVEKGSKQVLAITPKQYVDLSKDWTLFIGSSTPVIQPESQQTNTPTDQSEMYMLIEAMPPCTDKHGRICLRKPTHESAVRLSALTQPIAWKSGEPFGILVRATLEKCALTAMAFIDGVLELDDGLLVEHIATVGITGMAQSLLSRNASIQMLLRSSQKSLLPNVRPAQTIESNQTMERTNLSTTSSESLKDLEQEPSPHDPKSHKLPNVLVFTGSDLKETEHFLMLKKTLLQCLHPNKYVIYHITNTQMLTHPWIDNTALMVVSCEDGTHTSNSAVGEIVESFLANGGRLISFASRLYLPACVSLSKQTWLNSVIDVEYHSALANSTISLKVLHRYYSYALNKDNADSNRHVITVLGRSHHEPVILEVDCKDGKAILCQIRLDKDPTKETQIDSEMFSDLKTSNQARHQILLDMFSRLGLVCASGVVPSLTPCYLLAQSEELKQNFLASIYNRLEAGHLKSRLSDLHFVDELTSDADVLPDCLPVITSALPSTHTGFDLESYQANLRSKVLGHIILYCEVVPTTMNLFEGFMFRVNDNVGTVAIAARMTQGKGRGGNEWIAPKGCAMFSLHVRIPIRSCLGERLPFLQHIASAAMVEAVTSMPGYENIDLCLKWPNDIYYGNKMKVGGVIVNSSCWEKQFHAIIGCGFNVSNSDPTICINDLVVRHNQEHGTNLLPFTTEVLIAQSITVIEEMIEDFQLLGKESFLTRYYKRWLHSGSKVRLQNEDGPEVEIVGLDDSGFLSVRRQSGKVISVQPDGNSFDMMKNLLVTKTRP